MTNAGNPSTEATHDAPALPCLVVAGVFMVMCVLVAVAVLPPLLTLLFLPAPPVPVPSVLLQQQSGGHGVDAWTYEVGMPLCAVVAFYEAQGATCNPSPDCDKPLDPRGVHCLGQLEMAVFSARWRAHLTPYERDNQRTYGVLWREVNWAGQAPPEYYQWRDFFGVSTP